MGAWLELGLSHQFKVLRSVVAKLEQKMVGDVNPPRVVMAWILFSKPAGIRAPNTGDPIYINYHAKCLQGRVEILWINTAYLLEK